MALPPHKFQLGDSVTLTTKANGSNAVPGVYEIVRVLPSSGDDNQYRIKSILEPHERVVRESQLVAVRL